MHLHKLHTIAIQLHTTAMQLYCIQCNSANVQLSPGTAQRYEYWEISLGAILEAGYHSLQVNLQKYKPKTLMLSFLKELFKRLFCV